MSKITVKHFLNKNLKPFISPEGNEYKLYVLIRYINQNTKIKSLIEETFTEDRFNNIESESIYVEWMKKETELVEKTINILESVNYIFDIKTFRQFYDFSCYPIIKNLEDYIKWDYDQRNSFSDNFFHKENYKFNINLLNTLKRIVYNNENYLNNEIYLGLFKNDKTLESLKINQYVVDNSKTDKNNFIIEDNYILKEYDLSEFLKMNLFDRLFRLPEFNILPPTSDKLHILYKTIISWYLDE